jgi:hypothetical protein
MNDQEFKKHLKDMVHGHHHPEEHDWAEPGQAAAKDVETKAPAKKSAKSVRAKKTSGAAARKR